MFACVCGFVVASTHSPLPHNETFLASPVFGAYNPGGRLPVTFHFANYTDAVDFHEMGMRSNASSGHPGRTYR